MNPLYIDNQRTGLGIENRSLYIKDLKTGKLLEKFEPRSCPYDSIFVQRPNGFVSFGALKWLEAHSINLTILNWRGHILGQFLSEKPLSNILTIAQVKAHTDKKARYFIARKIVETKLWRQREFLKSLSESYPSIEIPKIESVNSTSIDFMRNQEARYAQKYFTEFGKVYKEIGFEFKRRNATKANMHAVDLINALMNYSYSLLQTYTLRALNSIGLDYSIPFLHELRPNKGLVYDLMEFWRVNADYSVIQTLRELKRSKKTHYLSDEYEIVLEQATVKTLFDNLKLNLSLEEIILNARILAHYLLGKKKTLEFSLRPVRVTTLFENESVKTKILTESYRELGMNKSTLWYQKKRLEETDSLRLYRITRHYFV